MDTIWRILKRPKLLALQALSLLLLFLNSGITILIPVLTAKWIDGYFATQSIDKNLMTLTIVYLIFGFLIPFVFTIINSIITEKLGMALKADLMRKILKQDYAYLAQKSGSKIFTVITSDVNFVKDVVGRLITALITAILMLIASVYLMYQASPAVAIPIFIVIPLIALIGVLVMRSAIKLFKFIQEKRDKLNNVIDENIKAAMLVRVFVSEDAEMDKFAVANENFKTDSIKVSYIFAWIFPLLNATMFVGQLIVLLVGGQQVMNGSLSLGQLSSFNALVIMFTAPFIIIGFISGMIGQAFASLARIKEVIDSPVATWPGKKELTSFEKVEFEDVAYKINKTKILSGINFKVLKSQKVGIIGITGSGKSTLLQLLIQFLYPTSGKILLNGENATKVNLNSYRKRIGFVPQQNFLFSGSILDNIKFDRELSEQDLMLASDTAEVTEFANKFAEKVNESVGEKGSKLSGGQKQRVTLARALAAKPEVLILDDSTSKLDSETESRIWANLKKNYPEITLVVVAQKISSIKDCDQIYVMDNGKIVDFGTHKQLLEKSFIYQELELTQSNYQAE